jgi:membrane-associated phospholipid phosphatase
MTFALLNTAVMDAGISCWDAKYHYWLIRPPQADPAITTPVGLPNFPSYVSGHATFSGAASEVLSAIFPARRSRLRAMAEEAALSRLYAGIHYRFDNDVGLRMGRSIGALALRRWMESGDDRRLFVAVRR